MLFQESSSNAWSSFNQAALRLKSLVTQHKRAQIDSVMVRTQAKELIQLYFRSLRPELNQLNLDTTRLDQEAQVLLGLSNKRSSKRLFVNSIKGLMGVLGETEIQREISISNSSRTASGASNIFQPTEEKILNTLDSLIPHTALAYKQVVFDLGDSDRVSYRGTVAELRETLREVLDHLAPDQQIVRAAEFRLEQGRSKPTMKQKVRFILKSRGLSKNEIQVPENCIENIENAQETIAAITRSIYERGSVNTHTQKGSQKKAAQQLKMYTDSILCELLEIS